MDISKEQIKVLFTEQELQERITEVAKQISQDYKNSEELIVVGVLKGAAIFCSDLIRKLDLNCQLEFIRLSSYDSGTESSGKVKAYDLALPSLEGKDVLVVEDIIDSGRTADFLMSFFQKQAGVKSLKLASLLDKPSRRLKEFESIKIDYTCFEIEDIFILGYGLDYEQRFRELPYLGYVDGLV